MSISPIIDQRYRLYPVDLGRDDWCVTIQNVSWQGLEQVAPLLHLREFPTKRLLLDPIQQQELQEITNSLQWADWIGQTLIIAAQSDHDRLRIHFYPLGIYHNPKRMSTPTIHIPESRSTTLLLLLLLILIFVIVALLDQ